MRQKLFGRNRVLRGPQVAALMRDPVRSRARSQLPRAQAPRPLCRSADMVRSRLICQSGVPSIIVAHVPVLHAAHFLLEMLGLSCTLFLQGQIHVMQ